MSNQKYEDGADGRKERRKKEQDGHRQNFSIPVIERNSREDIEAGPSSSSSLAQHPDERFDTQYFDGIDPHLSPNPPDNPDAKREYENVLRMQHQKKLEAQNTPQNNSAPRPGF